MYYTSEDLFHLIKKLDTQKLGILSSWNCSVRTSNNTFAIKPTWINYSDITIDDICNISTEGFCRSEKKPSSDFTQHKIIYDNNPEVNCIIHTHSHYATTLAILDIEIPVFCTMHADHFWNIIPCLKFINHRSWNFWSWIFYSKSKAYLLGKHWTLSLGTTIEDCYNSSIILEESAKLFYHSKFLWSQLWKNVESINQDDIDIINSYYKSDYGQ